MNGYRDELSSGVVPYGYLPSGEEEAAAWEEEPEVIEGEFREIPAVEVTPSSMERGEEEYPKVGPVRATGTQRRTEREIQRVKRAQLRAKRAQAETVTQDLRKKRFELGKARREEFYKTAGRISKAFAPAGAPGGAAQFYLGRPGRSLYVPERPTAEHLRESPAKRALQPHTERLRRATAPSTGTLMPIARTVAPSESLAQSPNYGFLRQFTLPSGTSKLEQAVFAEIRSNHDVDTLEHIRSELSKLGYGRAQVEQAMRALEGKGFIERQKLLPGRPPEYVVR